MKLLLTGVTGAAGSQILRSALADSAVTDITILSRRPLPDWLPVRNQTKPTESIILSDFMEYPPDVVKKLAGHDACIWALGVSSLGMAEAEYTKITYDYVVSATHALQSAGVGTTQTPFWFVFISGEGADPEGIDTRMARRIKGKAEKYLTSLEPDSNMVGSVIRPGFFFPSHPSDRMHTRGAGARALAYIGTPIFKAFMPDKYTPIEEMGKFAVEVAKGRWNEENTYSNVRMRELFGEM